MNVVALVYHPKPNKAKTIMSTRKITFTHTSTDMHNNTEVQKLQTHPLN